MVDTTKQNNLDDKYKSVAQTAAPFDPFESASATKEEDTDVSAQKKELTSLVIDKLKDSLKVSDELQDILTKIDDINADTESNVWKLNSAGNTATLDKHNATICKQNNYLCLSLNGEVHLLKSVEELHDFLNKNNLPLPSGIVLKESAEILHEEFSTNSPWHRILNTTKNVGIEAGIKANAEERLKAASADPTSREYHKAKEHLDNVNRRDFMRNHINDQIASGKTKSLNKAAKKGLDVMSADYTANAKPSEPYSRTHYKMNRADYKDATKFMPEDELDVGGVKALDREIRKANRISGTDELVGPTQSWYAVYGDSKNADEMIFLNKNWHVDGILFTNNIENAFSGKTPTGVNRMLRDGVYNKFGKTPEPFVATLLTDPYNDIEDRKRQLTNMGVKPSLTQAEMDAEFEQDLKDLRDDVQYTIDKFGKESPEAVEAEEELRVMENKKRIRDERRKNKEEKEKEKETPVEECGVSVGGSLGAAVQYVGDKKEESLLTEDDEILTEKVNGFPGTPFASVVYDGNPAKGKAYLNWIYSQNKDGNYNLDPKAEERIPMAKQWVLDHATNASQTRHFNDGIPEMDLDTGMGKRVGEKPYKMFKGMFDRNTGKIINPTLFKKRVEEINSTWGLDFKTDEPVYSFGGKRYGAGYEGDPRDYEYEPFKISDHNKAQAKKWKKEIWPTLVPKDYAVGSNFDTFNSNEANYKKSLEREQFERENAVFKDKANLAAYDDAMAILEDDTVLLSDFRLFKKIQSVLAPLTGEAQLAITEMLLDEEKTNDNINFPFGLIEMMEDYRDEVKQSLSKVNESTLREKYSTVLEDMDSEQVLTEDDKPEDFAKGAKKPEDPASAPEADNFIDTDTAPMDNDIPNAGGADEFADDMNDMNTDADLGADFGDGGDFGDFGGSGFGSLGGNYSPDMGDEGEMGMPMPPEAEYRIIDVLVNKEDESDIMVEVENLETGEVETKPLYEIDI